MWVWSNDSSLRIIPCWYQHEVWFDITNIDATRTKVKTCPLRAWWNNLLCAHTGLFPDEEKIYLVYYKYDRVI